MKTLLSLVMVLVVAGVVSAQPIANGGKDGKAHAGYGRGHGHGQVDRDADRHNGEAKGHRDGRGGPPVWVVRERSRNFQFSLDIERKVERPVRLKVCPCCPACKECACCKMCIGCRRCLARPAVVVEVK